MLAETFFPFAFALDFVPYTGRGWVFFLKEATETLGTALVRLRLVNLETVGGSGVEVLVSSATVGLGDGPALGLVITSGPGD